MEYGVTVKQNFCLAQFLTSHHLHMPIVIFYIRGGQLVACEPHVARHSIFNGPQND